MGSGELIAGFPHPNPTTSYWQLPPHSIANHRTTASLPSQECDYIIIGSGISGAAIAHKLLSRNASLSILMLEARTAASGASGRNGGHCRGGYWLNYNRYVEAVGEDDALRVDKLEEGSIQDIANFVREHNVDCDFQDVETADAYVTEEIWANISTTMKAREEVKQRRPGDVSSTEIRLWEGQAARDHMGMPGIVGAVTYPGHTQNPYRLVCKMLELSLEKGLNLQTTTTALNITANAKGGWSVGTNRGTVHGTRVVVATNGYTNAVHKSLADTGFLMPGRSQVTAIEPGTKMPRNPEQLLRGSAGLNDIGSGDYYLYRARDRHIIYGGGKSASKTGERNITDDSVVHPDVAAHLQHTPGEVFGREAWGDDGLVVRDWSGITCYTPDGFPLVGETPGQKGLWLSVAFNGHGMALTFRCAEALVEMMTTGKAPEWLPRAFRAKRAWEKNEHSLIGGQNTPTA
ncbi:hypothetical protein QQS21_003138 [Conoideocrella luteorostrata]|uniref:FAD dependent oxidoreductase domain-containing protein n=1 Tax=Conoideocrella luteorostrata TaxID=1105319 RepID=A0AAJ0CWN4_9HYPO|nr:hypothetical protein QQS21_003138 [Conoideocrella luteorostrata]